MIRDSFCSYCGTAYPAPLKYPRTCIKCETKIWSNPIPVSVVLVPVRHANGEGLLVVRRSIEPKSGLLALTGGFLEAHESWQQGGAREVREETGVAIDHSTLSAFSFASSVPKPNRVLLFSVARPIDASAMPPFASSNETSERGLIFGPDGLEPLFAFDLHVAAVQRYFAASGITGPNRYTQA